MAGPVFVRIHFADPHEVELDEVGAQVLLPDLLEAETDDADRAAVRMRQLAR